MKKLIAAFDGLKYSDSTENYALYLARQTNTHLVGVFLDDRLYTSYKLYELMIKEGSSENVIKKNQDADRERRYTAARNFEKACEKSGINFSIHHDQDLSLNELKHESIYADLLIIDSKETFAHTPEDLPTRFIRDLLSDVQCPVLLVPKKFDPITKIILLYDGEPSSVHAIKMFSYLLPQLKHLPVEVVSVNSYDVTLHLHDNKLIKEFMKRHYPNATYVVLQGLAEDEIVRHLKQEKEKVLVVLGAYQRGTVSRWFRESMADVLMKEIKQPLFIAHSK